ncbi:MAG: hypothetical protein J5644_06920 [Bacteroidales bacterium]|nr:hypothetical protein [Bacteroidales bacterium]
MSFRRVLILLALWWLPGALVAQQLGNLRFVTRTVDSTVILLDTLSIVPGSAVISGLDSSDYTLDLARACLHIHAPEAMGKTFTASYRCFQLDFTKPSSHKSTDLILPRFVADPSSVFLSPVGVPADLRLFDSQLQGNGSVSRSVSVGNQQNFVLDAHLNLQLSGFIAPDVEILAQITDENLPVQPEGNTRYIRDFNKVFIQLKYKDLLQVNAGDVELAAPDSTFFFRLNRQYIGLNAVVNSRPDSATAIRNAVGGGISKGKFVRNELTAINGVQGPYKLYGEQNEMNIVVLAGTEQVYLDGVLMTRGKDEDYTIDYNVGEITFTAQHLITSTHRIIVYFEYCDQYYSRFNLFTTNTFTHEKNAKWLFTVNYFHEQDLKSQSIQPELTWEQMDFLSHAGDQTEATFYPTATQVADFSLNEILYHQGDTVVNGVVYTPVYVYAGTSHDSVFRVNFSYVGPHRGNYVLTRQTANGKLFQWVAPENGEPQGDYEPVALLNTPKMSDLATVGAAFSLNDRFRMHTELAFSYQDQNLFSKSDDRDNAGLAYKIQLDYKKRLRPGRHRDSLWTFRMALDEEFVHRQFSPLEPFRDVEFSRDYNLTSLEAASEQWLRFSAAFAHPGCGTSSYSANWFVRIGQFSAFRNELVSAHRFKGWQWNANTALLNSTDKVQHSFFVKSMNDFSKSFRKIRVGVKDNVEYNIFKDLENNMLRPSSYAFNDASLYLVNSDSLPVAFLFQYRNRVDYVFHSSQLSMNTMAHEAKASLELAHWRHHRLKAGAIYRYENVRDTTWKFHGEQNFVMSADYSGSFCNGAISLMLYYEAGSGLEQKKNYTYLKVATGQGTHVWNDYNGNNIEELDEFEPAAFQNEADYVKVWLTTNEYVNTRNCGTTQSLQLRPANVWRQKKGFLKFLSLWSNTTTLRAYQKNTSERMFQSINPFRFSVEDTALVSSNLNLKNSLAFALPSPWFSADYSIMRNQAKNLLYYGFESTRLDWQQVLFRFLPLKELVIKLLYERSVNQCASAYLNTRNYELLSHQLKPSLTLSLKQNCTISAEVELAYKKNREGREKANIYKAELSADYRMKERGVVRASLKYVDVISNSFEDNSLSYEMLDGLSRGHNLLWSLSCQTMLFEYLQLNLQYEGRVNQERRQVHTGFVQLKAFF